jgi:precorrin-6B methylase 2
MSRRKATPRSEQAVPQRIQSKVRPPLVVVLGSPAEVMNLVSSCEVPGARCYQMDLFQAERLRALLDEAQLNAEVITAPDLWDLSADFQTAIYLPARGGERDLKIDMIEQAFHVLKPRGQFVIWSPHETDRFFPLQLKKVFGRVHADNDEPVFWSQRDGERPRRRHEVTYQARVAGGEPCRFLSRPGTFSYGRLDDGARALAEVMEIEPGDRVLDIGCGVGTNGVFAAQRTGPEGRIAFVDSNVRATALAELNARSNGVGHFDVVASCRVEGLPAASFDVALANPPYHAGGSIAQLFVERAREMLTPQGRLYLVTKQPEQCVSVIEETFGAVEAFLRRGYTVLRA